MKRVTADVQGVEEAALAVRAGELVAFPTETVYGLGADATQDHAVANIFRAKGRPADNPLIVHVAAVEEARSLAARWTPLADRLARRFWPGPLTLVVEARPVVALTARAGLDTVGLRWPAHPVAEALIRAAERPLAAPSANRSGRPSPTTADAVAEDLAAAPGVLLDGGPTGIGVESTVLLVTGSQPVLLRPGGLALEAIEDEVGPVLQARAEGPIRSPGVKYRHYAPACPVVLMGGVGDVADTIRSRFPPASTGVLAPTAVVRALPEYPTVDLGEDDRTAAARLFDGLRRLERTPGVQRIVAVWDNGAGLGRAVLNRLQKAAGVEAQ
jgi:L-threonylcarbamoyladenylate synthase